MLFVKVSRQKHLQGLSLVNRTIPEISSEIGWTTWRFMKYDHKSASKNIIQMVLGQRKSQGYKSHPKKGRCQQFFTQFFTADFSTHFHGFRSWVLLRGRFFSGYLNGRLLFHTFSSVCFFVLTMILNLLACFCLVVVFICLNFEKRKGGLFWRHQQLSGYKMTCDLWDLPLRFDSWISDQGIFWLPWQVKCCQEGKPLPLRLVSGWSGVFNPVCWLLLVSHHWDFRWGLGSSLPPLLLS